MGGIDPAGGFRESCHTRCNGKKRGGDMKTGFWIHSTMLVAAAAIAAALSVPPAEAQQFSPWSAPVNLGPVVNSASLESAPNLTTDGHWLYFHSKRPTWITADGVEVPNCGGVEADLYVSHRQDKRDDLGWENPINLGCTINTPGFDN